TEGTEWTPASIPDRYDSQQTRNTEFGGGHLVLANPNTQRYAQCSRNEPARARPVSVQQQDNPPTRNHRSQERSHNTPRMVPLHEQQTQLHVLQGQPKVAEHKPVEYRLH